MSDEVINPRNQLAATHQTAAAVVFCLLLYSCGPSEDTRGQRYAVQGKVTLDGEPLTAARIIFIGQGGEGAVRATGEVEDGNFLIPVDRGALAGTNTVEVHPMSIDLEELEQKRDGNAQAMVPINVVDIPKRYYVKSKLTAEVTAVEEPDAENAAEKNSFTFELKSKL